MRRHIILLYYTQTCKRKKKCIKKGSCRSKTPYELTNRLSKPAGRFYELHRLVPSDNMVITDQGTADPRLCSSRNVENLGRHRADLTHRLAQCRKRLFIRSTDNRYEVPAIRFVIYAMYNKT